MPRSSDRHGNGSEGLFKNQVHVGGCRATKNPAKTLISDLNPQQNSRICGSEMSIRRASKATWILCFFCPESPLKLRVGLCKKGVVILHAKIEQKCPDRQIATETDPRDYLRIKSMWGVVGQQKIQQKP